MLSGPRERRFRWPRGRRAAQHQGQVRLLERHHLACEWTGKRQCGAGIAWSRVSPEVATMARLTSWMSSARESWMAWHRSAGVATTAPSAAGKRQAAARARASSAPVTRQQRESECGVRRTAHQQGAGHGPTCGCWIVRASRPAFSVRSATSFCIADARLLASAPCRTRTRPSCMHALVCDTMWV